MDHFATLDLCRNVAIGVAVVAVAAIVVVIWLGFVDERSSQTDPRSHL